MSRRYVKTVAVTIKRILVLVISAVIILNIYLILLPNVWYRDHLLISLIILWLLSAYIVLPRLHRLLSKLYVPQYFIGRTRTADGLLGDPVNLAVIGKQRDLTKALKKAGWQPADPKTLKTGLKIVWCGLRRRPYPSAPVSDLFIFGRKQDLAYQMEVGGNPRQRHHVRFWKTPTGWYLPGGHKADWLGAATYDKAVGLSWFTGQITHTIDINIDKERDFLLESLRQAETVNSYDEIKHFFPAYRSINGGGNRVMTDGSLAFVHLLERHSK